MCDSSSTERPLQIAPNAQNVALGEEGLYTHSAKVTSDEKTAIRI